MANSIKSLGDRMLARLAPKAEAAGGCPPDCWYQHKCDSSGTYLLERRCCYNGACATFCGSWYKIGNC